jgi:hypothetical protein
MRPNVSTAEGTTSRCVEERVPALHVDHLPTSQAVAIAFVGHVLGVQIHAHGIRSVRHLRTCLVYFHHPLSGVRDVAKTM